MESQNVYFTFPVKPEYQETQKNVRLGASLDKSGSVSGVMRGLKGQSNTMFNQTEDSIVWEVNGEEKKMNFVNRMPKEPQSKSISTLESTPSSYDRAAKESVVVNSAPNVPSFKEFILFLDNNRSI